MVHFPRWFRGGRSGAATSSSESESECSTPSESPTSTRRAPTPPAPGSRAAALLEAAGSADTLRSAARDVEVFKGKHGGKKGPLRVLHTPGGDAHVVYLRPALARGASYKVYRGVDLNTGRAVVVRRSADQDPTRAPTFWHDLADELTASALCGNDLDAQDLLTRQRPGKPDRTYVTQPLMCMDMLAAAEEVLNLKRYPGDDWQAIASLVALHVAHEIAPSLKSLHDHGWAHRDLKPENLLLDSSRGVRLTDLNAAAEVGSAKAAEAFGTANYMARDVLVNKNPRLLAADVWSLGATLWAVAVADDYPFLVPHAPANRIFSSLMQVHEELSDWYPRRHQTVQASSPQVAKSLQKVLPPLRGLITDMIHPWPEARPTMAQVCARLASPAMQVSSAQSLTVQNFLSRMQSGGGGRNFKPVVDYAQDSWSQSRGPEAAGVMARTLRDELFACGLR